jgi:hypothetical protein
LVVEPDALEALTTRVDGVRLGERSARELGGHRHLRPEDDLGRLIERVAFEEILERRTLGALHLPYERIRGD